MDYLPVVDTMERPRCPACGNAMFHCGLASEPYWCGACGLRSWCREVPQLAAVDRPLPPSDGPGVVSRPFVRPARRSTPTEDDVVDPELLAAEDNADPNCMLCDGQGWWHTHDVENNIDGQVICACTNQVQVVEPCPDCNYTLDPDDPEDVDPCDAHEAHLEMRGFRF